MRCNRREWLSAGAAGLLASRTLANPTADAPRTKMGVVIHSYGIRRSAERGHGFDDPLRFLEYCRSLGAGGVQTSLGVREEAACESLRRFADDHQLVIEGSISLPRDRSDVDRFDAEVRTAKQCGATVFRTVLMTGRRYEVFDTAEAFRRFREQGKHALALARPVVETHEIRMAVENHKDLEATELLERIESLDSPFIGVCLDTGNNIALLERPEKTVAMLAPHAFTTHIKDMGVEEYEEGFLLAEVPLGEGFLDLPAVVADIRNARPEARLNLEMITRDPLKIPCLTSKYWVTLEDLPGRRLAEMLALARGRSARAPLPRMSVLSKDAQIQREDENVRRSLRYARERLDA